MKRGRFWHTWEVKIGRKVVGTLRANTTPRLANRLARTLYGRKAKATAAMPKE